MDVSFATHKLEKLCLDIDALTKKYGPRCASLVLRRIDEMRYAATLDEILKMPTPRLHWLKGPRSNQLAVDLVHPKRLVLEPTSLHTKDMRLITAVTIVEIVDYH